MNIVKFVCGEEVGNRAGRGGRGQWDCKLRLDRREIGCQVKVVYLLCENLCYYCWGFVCLFVDFIGVGD